MSTTTLSPRSREGGGNNPTTTAIRVSDTLWAVLEPLIALPANTIASHPDLTPWVYAVASGRMRA